MKFFLRIVFCLLLIGVVAVILIFMLENQQTVSPVLLGWPTPQVPLAVAICVALLAGLLLGALLTGLNGFRLRRRLAIQRHELRKCRELLAQQSSSSAPSIEG